MNFSFHYYGTYCAAREAGFGSDDAWVIAHSAQFVDDCSKGLLENHGKTGVLPTVHTTEELVKLNIGWFGSPFPKEIPQVWTSFHFLPGNLTEEGRCRLPYRNPEYISDPAQTELFKLLCLPYSYMSGKIVDAAKREYLSEADTHNKKLSYIGMVMHVLADTFAHEYFVGTPSKAINEVSWITEFDSTEKLKPYKHSSIRSCENKHSPMFLYSPALSSTSVGWLGHGRIGTNPDISNKKYFYKPNWNPDAECTKNNPILYLSAFAQMTNAMKFILDTADEGPFDYKKELTADEYECEYSSKLMEIFTSKGDEKTRCEKWASHIYNIHNQSVIAHDAELLASDSGFLNDFTDNAGKHMSMVCQYCSSAAPSLTYFNI